MSDSVVEEIKRKLDLVDVVSSYVKLQKVGVNYRATSPFHTEKTPSFFVSPSKQIWHDFSSGKGGDMFKFVMELENIEFIEALRILAKRAGVELKESPQWQKNRSDKEKYFEINELATKFFEKQLHESTTGKKALEYLLSRGLNLQTIKDWRIGFAPDTWRGLTDFLARSKFTRFEIEKAGLCIQKPNGEYYDRFRLRIMFPICDQSAQVVGFTGRVVNKQQEEQGMAKYMNIPNTLLYDKSQALYGIDKAKQSVLREQDCILVEGQMDVIMSHQAGVNNVVASSGTALTEKHLSLLKRYCKNLTLAFDMDLGGNNATERGIKMAIAQGFNVKTITMPEGDKDPADVAKESPEKWQELAKSKKSIVEFYFIVAFAKFKSVDIDGKKAISAMVLPIIKRLPNKIEQTYWLEQLAGRLQVKEAVLEEEMVKIKDEEIIGGGQGQPVVSVNKPVEDLGVAKTRKDMLEERIVSLLLLKQNLKNLLSEDDLSEFAPKWNALLTEMKSQSDFKVENLADENFRLYLQDLAFQREIQQQLNEDIKPEGEFEVCLQEFRMVNIRQKMNELSMQIRRAEMCHDGEFAKTLCEEFQKLSKKLTQSI